MTSPVGNSTLSILITFLLLRIACSDQCGFWKGATTKENFNVNNYCSYYCPGAGYSDSTCGRNTCYCTCNDGSTPSFYTQECAAYDGRAVDPVTFYVIMIYAMMSLICVVPAILVCMGCCLHYQQKREQRAAEAAATTNRNHEKTEIRGKSLKTSNSTLAEEDEEDVVEAIAIHTEAIPLHSNHCNQDFKKDKSGIPRAYLVAPPQKK